MSLLQKGCGSFVFDDPIRRAGVAVHYFYPDHDVTVAPIVMAMHGVDRVATDVRDAMAKASERHGQIVLVPEFDANQFPGLAAYNFGGAGSDVPREAWTFAIIDRLFAYVRSALNSQRERFGLFGNSAGAQFVLRYMALMNAERIEAAVASNSGVYMLPDIELAYPDGMGGLNLDEQALRRYLGRRLTLLIGSEDSDPAAHDLPRWEHAMAQGPHRLARAHWYFQHCTQIAMSLETPLNWSLEAVPGAGHVSQEVFDRAALLLKLASEQDDGRPSEA